MPEATPNLPLSTAKRPLFKLTAVVLSVLFCFLCLEIALRLWGPEYYPFRPDDLYYTNPRGYFDWVATENGRPLYGVPIRCAGEPPRRLPDDVRTEEAERAFLGRDCTILGLGDSFTVGQGVRYKDLYLTRLEKRLAQEGKPALVDNAAGRGYDLETIYEVYRTVAAEHRYPLVIYGFVLNDFGPLARIVGLDYIDFNNGGYTYNPWRTRFASLNFVCYLIERIRLDRHTRKAFFELYKGDSARRGFRLLRRLDRAVKKDGGTLVVVLFPLLYRLDDYPFQSIHDQIADFCRKEDILLLDLRPALASYPTRSLWVHPMDHHPNEIAHRVAADAIYDFLHRHQLLDKLQP